MECIYRLDQNWNSFGSVGSLSRLLLMLLSYDVSYTVITPLRRGDWRRHVYDSYWCRRRVFSSTPNDVAGQLTLYAGASAECLTLCLSAVPGGGGKSSIQFDDFIYSNKDCWRLGTWALWTTCPIQSNLKRINGRSYSSLSASFTTSHTNGRCVCNKN